MNDVDIGKRFKMFRKKYEIGQVELARLSHISRENLSACENGKRRFPTDFLLRVAERYKISLDWLVYGYGDMLVVDESNPVYRLEKIDIENAFQRKLLPADINRDLLSIERHLFQLALYRKNQ